MDGVPDWSVRMKTVGKRQRSACSRRDASRLRLALPMLVAAMLTIGGGVSAQSQPPAPTTAAPAIRDERALRLLKGMTDTLGQAKTLSFRARSLVPTAAPTGQWISLLGTS